MNKRTTKDFGGNQILHKASYNPKDCQVGVIHIGLGNFHRAHQAVYFHNLLSKMMVTNWGIAGVNLRPEQSNIMKAFKRCKNKYILKTVSPDGDIRFEEIKSILAMYEWAEQLDEVLCLFSSNEVHLITITVTESGYYLDKDNQLNINAQDIQDDLSGETSKTIFGSLSQGLRYRMENGGSPITVACCDNLPQNGVLLKRCFKQYLLKKNDVELLNWVSENVSFPSSMVDRITLKIETNVSQEIREKFNQKDDCSVISESFIQWVIEDDFAGIRPPLEDVGVEIVDDVFSYENTKIRILNGGHIALTYLGILRGHKTYDAALKDPVLSVFFDAIQTQEILPALPLSSLIDYEQYLKTTKRRFKNQHLPDSLERIGMDGASKFPFFLLPTIEWHLSKGSVPIYSIKSIASWYVFLCKVDTNNIGFNYVEPKWNMLTPFLNGGGEKDFASSSNLWGDVPEQHPDFVNTLVEEIQIMKETFDINFLDISSSLNKENDFGRN